MLVDAPTTSARSDPLDRIVHIEPPCDDELWSYVAGDGKRFMQFSALSRICLGGALVFLALRGDLLLLLLPFGIGVVLGGVINMVWSTQIRPFDRVGHEHRVLSTERSTASIDVFICTCGEDPAVVENTIVHATALRHGGAVVVHVLDDGADPDVERAARRWGARYVVRPRRGWMKKSGNLQHGYEHSDGEFILVLDADFAVRPDFLEHTLGYFEDPALGILQSPQFFRCSRDNWVERGAAAQQEQFYRIGLRARDTHGGAICVGTNAVYRRAALDERGGMALLEHSEDIFTGMKVVDAGYRVDYLPLPLAAGSTPSTTAALASQQYRWARGNFALAGTPLFKRMKLRGMQRLGLWDGWIFYITSALSPIVALFVPIVSLAEAPEAITLAPAAMILPALFTEFYLQPKWLHLPDGKASRRVGLISQVAHLYALRDHLTDRDQEWIPTGGQRDRGASQNTDRIPDQIATAAVWGFAITVCLIGVRVATGWSIVDLAPVGVLAALALPAALGTTAPAVSAPRRATSTLSPAPEETERDSFLDVVRAISIIRVMFWHALGFWWISWTFAAMPAVFYVSGAVLAKSMRRASCWTVVRNRLRRLVPPYLAYVGIMLIVVTLAAPGVVTDSTSSVVSWVIPYRSPAPLAWEEGWLSSPLWFLRALVVVLLLTPLVRPIGRRIPGVVSALVWLAALPLLDLLVERQTTELAVAVARGIGDVVCFGGFFALGIAGHHLRYKLSRLARVRCTLVLAAASLGVAFVQRPPDLVVNNSYLLFGLVGLTWLMAMLAVEDHLRHLGDIPAIARLVRWMTDGAMSIYLWHTLALVLSFWLVGIPDSPGEYLVLSGVFVVSLVVLVNAVRPLESLGHRRSRAGGPPIRVLSVLVVAGALAGLVGQSTLFPPQVEDAGPPTPSGRPPFGSSGPAEAPSEVSAEDAAAMAHDGEAWLRGHRVDAAAAVEIGPATGDQPELIRYGDTDALDPAAPFEALSVTKTMVAAVALQLVDEGRLTLDEPLPDVTGVDTEITGSLTLRRLLSHATGLTDYREKADYHPDMILDAVAAVELSADGSDLTTTTSSYAAPNYLLAGLVIEAVTGQPLADVMRERLFEPLGLERTEMVNNRREGFVGGGSAGVVSTLEDLAIWYDALIRRGAVLSPEMRDEMLWGGMEYQGNAGLGAWRHCPCDPPTIAEPEPFLYVFHDGGDVRLLYIPSRQATLAIRLSKPLYDADQIVGDIDDLVFAVADRRTRTAAAPD